MADSRPIAPWLKSALELGPPILFFLAYLRLEDSVWTIGGREYSGFIVATVIFIPILLVSMGILWRLTGKISRIQVFTAVMVLFFGGLTVWFNDESFFKMKTTLVYGFFAVALGIGLLRGQSWLQFLMGEVLQMEDEGWMILTRRICAAFALMAVANEIVWRTQSDQFWVTFETFGLPAFLFVVFMAQARLIERFSPDDEGEGGGTGGA
ncbi:septation protein A [Rhodobacterales bacterium HKCCE3408]|nr:septation protein A [Rhodobacterales bacterium HKCCE3408]